MDNIVFPFEYEVLPNFGRVFFPIVKIGLETIDGVVKYNFILDTGADQTTLPKHMAYRLGIDLKKAKRSIVQGLGGHIVQTWSVKLKLLLNSQTSVLVRASITDENSTPFLLGRADLLDKIYSWNFDCKNKKIVFEKI